MFPYWILIAVWTVGAVQFNRAGSATRAWPLYGAALLFTAAFMGFRYHVGGDWGSYELMFASTNLLGASYLLSIGDPGYIVLNWIVGQAGFGIVTVNLICSLIVVWGLGRFASHQPNPWLTIVVAAPYFILVVAMGYTRQAVAIGIIMAGISDLQRTSLPKILIYIFVGALFHKTAVLMIPVLAVAAFRKNLLAGILGALTFVALYFVFLNSSADRLITNYANSNYDSQGAAIRVAMDVAAAMLLFLFRKKMGFNDFERVIWLTFSAGAILCIPALLLVSASSGVDRIALFLIPLQLVTISRLPYALSSTSSSNKAALAGVIIYCFAIQFAWLNYAVNAEYWLPYRFALTDLEASSF